MTKKYPEHEKLHAVKDESESIGAFIDWLTSTGRTCNNCGGHKNEHDKDDYCMPDEITKWDPKPAAICEWKKEVGDPLMDNIDTSYEPEGWYPIMHGRHDLINELLAEYFEIDLDKIDREKEEMYQEIRQSASKRKVRGEEKHTRRER